MSTSAAGKTRTGIYIQSSKKKKPKKTKTTTTFSPTPAFSIFPASISPIFPFPLRRPLQSRRLPTPPERRYLAREIFSRAPGKIPFNRESRAASRKLKTHSGWLCGRGHGHNWIRRSRREFGPWLSLLRCCLAQLNFSVQIVALTCGDPEGQQRPEADEDPRLQRPRGHLAPVAGRCSSGNRVWLGCVCDPQRSGH